jgi:26S proteasome non-ATPase regulatory subunit 9
MQSIDPSIPPASADDAKALLRSLISQKDILEAQLEALHSQSAVGQSLIDSEGFPRSDIDVHAVRNARNELIRMQNDHKDLMKRIEHTMFNMHAQAKAQKAREHPEAIQSVQQVRSGSATVPRHGPSDDAVTPPSSSSTAAAATASPALPPAGGGDAGAIAAASNLSPFYTVNSVSDDSPASVAGLRAGDLILQFGSVTSINKSASSMAAVVSSSIGRALHVTVRRGGEIKFLKLIPQSWGGRGMLGCHLVDV